MPSEDELAKVIVDLLAQRAPTSSICPSDAARAAGAQTDDPDGWRDLMDPVRRAALGLLADGRVRITQKDREITDLSTVRGPVRIRRGPRF